MKSPAGSPMLAIELRRDALAELGALPVDVLETVALAYQGRVVAETHAGNRTEDVVVTLPADVRGDPTAVGALLVRTIDGASFPLGALADIRPESGRASILHKGARRRQSVTCVPRDRDVVSFSADVERAIRERVSLPPGTYVEVGGTAQAQTEARNELLAECGVAAIAVALLLWLAFRSTRLVALVLANVPFGLVGGVAAVLFVGLVAPDSAGLTMGALVGFITLLGITMRNSIMLISHYRHLVEVEGASWDQATVVRGATDRVVPILMTALVTGLGLLPLALGTGTAGREIEGPMAIVILGGLASSTALNLLVLPSLAARTARFRRAEPGAAMEQPGPGVDR